MLNLDAGVGVMHVGIIGFGYWGRNITRNFLCHSLVDKVTVCDSDAEQLSKAKTLFPVVETTNSYDILLNRDDIDVIAVVTPIRTHFEIAKAALERKKHVLVEKTMTTSSEQAADLIRLAKKTKKVLAVDHTFTHAPAVKKIKTLVDSRVLGSPWYYDSVRVNLGLFQHDVNVLWDLAAHDLSILLELFESRPVEISVQGACRAGGRFEDIAYLTLFYECGFLAHIHVNWLAPTKVRQVMIGGSEKMLIWDDLEASEKVRVYDKGVEFPKASSEEYHSHLVKYRLGDMSAPAIDPVEPLNLLVDDFLRSVRDGAIPLSCGKKGMEVVAILEAADQSLRAKGQRVSIHYPRV